MRDLYVACKIDELLETIQMHADNIATNNEKDKGEKKALELYVY